MEVETKKETSVGDEFADLAGKYMPFIVEIRRRLFWIAALFLTSAVLGFVYYEKIINLFLKSFRLEGVNIVFTSPFQFFNLAMSSGLLVGGIVVFPLVAIQLVSFLKPALSKHEYAALKFIVPISTILFLLGVVFGGLVMRYVMQIFYQKSSALNIGNFLDISALISQIVVTASLMGLGFQFPLVITLLIKLNIVKYKYFVKQRWLAYLIAVVFSALMPPTDLVSLVLLTLPLVLLFEFTLLLNKIVLKTHLL